MRQLHFYFNFFAILNINLPIRLKIGLSHPFESLETANANFSNLDFSPLFASVLSGFLISQ